MEEQNTDNKKCVNKGRPVYFSYARNSAKKPGWDHISDCVDELLKVFEQEDIEYRLDKRDIGTGDKISDFEREIGWKSEAVVLVFSDKYFRSPHCMFEFVQIKKSLELYPQKRLLCIKSGDFNLSDVNYIMELERFWSTKKQEYEEIEFHRLRNHSGTEKAEFENGFYMDDIRNLYSFFSAINYQYSNNIDWKSFIDDIRKYYSNTPKPNLKALYKSQHKLKLKPMHILAALVGIVALVAALIFLLVVVIKPDMESETETEIVGLSHPEYTKGTKNFYVTNINTTKRRTVLQFHFINDSNSDREIYASEDFRIKADDGKEYRMTKAKGIATSPDKTKVAKGGVLNFTLEFPAIPPNTVSIDFIGGEYYIQGLLLLRMTSKPITSPYVSTGNYGQLTISEVELNDSSTVLHLLFKNTDTKAVWIAPPERPFLYADRKKYKLKNTSGIAVFPDSTLVPQGTSIGYALIFEPIKAKEITKFDYVSSEDRQTNEIKGYFGINIERSK